MKRKFLKNKICMFCKKEAVYYRFYNSGKFHYLCNNEECELKSRKKLKLYGEIKLKTK